jgi:hypothetical protein
MRILIGLELENEGQALAWALDFPGCFASGNDGPEAVIRMARAVADYETWVNQHAGKPFIQLRDYDLRVVETWPVYTINDQYELQEGGYAVNAWFLKDWRPLSAEEVEYGLAVLRWAREDLLAVAAPLSDEVLDRCCEGERWSIRGILKHVANAEYWYLTRLNLIQEQRSQLPEDATARLNWIHERTLAAFAGLPGVEQVVGREGEFWSPRKLLRRVLWHDMNHRQHIQKLLAMR